MIARASTEQSEARRPWLSYSAPLALQDSLKTLRPPAPT